MVVQKEIFANVIDKEKRLSTFLISILTSCRGSPIMIEVKKFEPLLFAKYGEIEPVFLSMCLVDIAAKKKISETFHVDTNSNEIMSWIPTFKPTEKATRLKRAVFNITHRTSDIVLFVKVSKVLQGDEDSSTKPYTNAESVKEGDAKKMKKAAQEFVARLAEFEQTIAWTSIPVFDSDSLLPIENPKASQFYRTKGSFTVANFLSMFDNTSNDTGNGWQASATRKLKTLPATLTMQITNLVDYKPEYDGPIALVNDQDDDIKPRVEAIELREFAPHPPLVFNGQHRNFLYVCPDYGHYSARLLSSTSSRNITVKMELRDNDKDLSAPGLPVIFGKNGGTHLQNCAYTEVSYHNRHPEFGDEFKILLPTNITPQHHILFTHYHVSAQEKKNKTTVIGYTVVPLLSEGKLINETKSFAIVHEFSKKTEYTSAEVRSNSKLLDSGKHVFQVTFHADSTIYPSDGPLTQFFRKLPLIMKRDEPSSPTQLLGGDPDASVTKAILDLVDHKAGTPPQLLIQNLPMVFNLLIKTVCNPSLKNSSTNAFKVLLRCIEIVSDQDPEKNSGRNELVSQYIDQMFLDADAFEPLLIQLYSYINAGAMQRKQKAPEEKTVLQYSWCIFELIYKSLVIYLDKNGHLKNHRVERWVGSSFQDSIDKLTKAISLEIAYRAGQGLNLAKLLNSNFALFLRDLCNVVDRGLIIQKAAEYLRNIGTFGSPNMEVLQELRATFLQVFIDYEHFVPLSLPSPVPTPNDKIRDHYAAGLLIENVLSDLTNAERVVRQRVINLIKAVLTKHDYDNKYQKTEHRERIATVYFPFVTEFLGKYDEYVVAAENKLPKLNSIIEKWTNERSDRSNLLSNHTLSSPSDTKSEDTTRKLTNDLEQAQKQLDDAETQLAEEMKRIKNEKQSMFINILWILKNSSRKMLREWWKTETPARTETFISWLSSCLQVYEYEGKDNIRKRAEIGAETSTTKTLSEAKNQLESMYTNLEKRTARAGSSIKRGATPQKGGVRNFKVNRMQSGSHSSINLTDTTGGTSTGSMRKEPQKVDEEMVKNMVMWEGNLNTEVSLVVLEAILEFAMDLNIDEVSRQTMIFIESLFKIFGQLFTTNQSETVLLTLFSILRVLIRQFAIVIFSNESSYSEQLCKQLLQMCYSKFERVRGEACAVLYHLIRVNYETLGNFTRTKIQTTVALSTLTGDKQFGEDRDNVTMLRASFEVMAQYAAEDTTVKQPSEEMVEKKRRRFSLKSSLEVDLKDLDLSFGPQVKQLVDRLNKTLSDTVKIREADKEDEENYAELFYRIANGYRHAPELSVAWFGNLGVEHMGKERFVEAAQTDIYVASVVYHYLRMKGDPFAVSQGVNFEYLKNVSPQIRTEKFQELQALFLESTDKPDFESHYFHPKGFVELIQRAIKNFDQDSYYEYSIQLWKLLVEHYEKTRQYDMLVKAHEEVSKLYGHISRANMRNTRLFGSYYRITFYGQKVAEDIRGQHYIYKMPKIFRLAEIVDYFQGNFSQKYGGSEFVKVVGDTTPITDQIINDPTNVHVLVTNVRPHTDREDRQTQFEQNADINQFVFETPFTKSGKAHGALNEQYKRRTILTVETAFPNMLTRNAVIDVSQVELTPIQNAIEIVSSSIDKLDAQVVIDPPDVNSLHMVLSGSIIPQVNEGIPQIINLFLKDPEPHKKEDIEILKSRMRDFLKSAGKGLEISRKNSKPTQMPLHEKFEEGFATLYELFGKYLDVSDLSGLIYVKKKRVNFA
jgi:hypothetical protein